MRHLLVNLIALSLIVGLSCKDNPVEELPAIVPAEIFLSANYSSILVGGEAAIVFAFILAENGDTLGAGYPIRFEITDAPATSGPESPSFEYIASADSVLLEVEAITNSSGRASILFYSGITAGNVTIKASYLEDENIFVEESLITILPMPISRIVLTSNHDAIPHGGASTIIYAGIEDIHGVPTGEGNSVRLKIFDGPYVNNEECSSFEYPATEDSVLREVELIADHNGMVSVDIFSGTVPGIVQIKATLTTDTTISTQAPLIVITSDNYYNIELSATDSTIEVGYNTASVYATLRDWQGNPAGDGYEIRLDIIGTYYGHPVFILPGGDDYDSTLIDTTDINGQVSGELRSGTKAGQVAIKATALFDTSVCTQNTFITIIAGPPYIIEIFPSTVVEAYNHSYYSTIMAVPWDEYTNPVLPPPDFPIYFAILPDSIATIESPVYADSLGIIRSQICYPCYHIFDTIRVIVNIDPVTDTSAAFLLPLYQGNIAIDAQPGILYITPPDTVGYADIEIQLLTGISCPVHNGVINFTTQVCGEISGPLTDTTDFLGYAYTEFMIRADELPENPPDPPQCTAIIKARLRGYPDIESEYQLYCAINQGP